MKYIDTHSHYNDEKFNEDVEELLKQIEASEIKKIINVGVDVKSSKEVLKMAENRPYMYTTMGIHPTEEVEEDYINTFREMYKNNKDKIVAIGEIGLDYYWEKDKKEHQIKLLKSQIELANELKLPIVIHSRDASEDIVKVLKETEPKYGCVFHCYQPSEVTLKLILEKDYYISLTGNITFKRNTNFYNILNQISLERIMLETDCPYMAPEPYRGTRNSSLNIPIIAQKLAEIKNVTLEEISKVTYANSIRFYKLGA